MKCGSQLDISSKFSIANEYVLCRYKCHHPIVLIGHSFGGLVLKSLVVKLKRRSTFGNRTDSWSKATVQHGKVFLTNVRGLAFYAGPHAGSNNIPKYVNKLLRCNNRHHPAIMDNIQPWQQDMEQLSVDFDDIVKENEINIYAFCEGRPMEVVRMCWIKWIFLQPVML
jgi:triacylglycerol esterase/lipase EstA (alpha/beta hydrolase family)